MSRRLGLPFDPSRHPSPDEPRGREELAFHLLADCPVCREQAEGWWQGEGGEGLVQRVRRSLVGVPERARRERREAAAWVERLRDLPPGRQWTVLRSARGARVPAMVDRLIAEADGRLSSEIREAIRWAELAVEVAGRLDGEVYGAGLVRDYEARALVALARARRRASEFRVAARTLKKAKRALEEGTGDPLELGALLEEEGELRTSERRFSEAFEVFRRTLRCYRRLDEGHAIGRTLIRFGGAHHEANEPEEALLLLRRAAGFLDAKTEPRWTMALLHNLGCVSVEAGRVREGMAYLTEAEKLYRRFARPVDVVRLNWAKAKILIRYGRPESAVRLLRDCQEEFAKRNLPDEAATVALELAMVLAELGRFREICEISLSLLEVFDALEVRRETAAAVLCLRQAAEFEVVNQALIASLRAKIERRARDAEDS